MPNKTSIEWTDRSWNPIRARNRENGKIGWYCEHRSDGCGICYSEVINHRFGTGVDFARQNRDRVELFLDEKALRKKMPPAGSMVFVCDMTDLFGEFVQEEWIDRIFEVIAEHPDVIFQILTKRPERMLSYLSARPLIRNVWAGVSVENRRELWRLDQLRETPPRFVSSRSSHCSSHTAPDVRPLLERLCLVHRLLPFPVGQWPRLNNAAPSLQSHYRAFDTTTGCSAPAPRFGTLTLAVGAACGLSLHVVGRDEAQGLTFHRKAWSSFAPPTYMPDSGSIRASPELIPEEGSPPGSDIV
jgi:protein gp37